MLGSRDVEGAEHFGIAITDATGASPSDPPPPSLSLP
jgi:hypothetical protein